MSTTEEPLLKRCTNCHESKPLSEFQRRTGRKAGPYSRRGPCRACRQSKLLRHATEDLPSADKVEQQPSAEEPPHRQARSTRPSHASVRHVRHVEQHRHHAPLVSGKLDPEDARELRANRNGMIRMRGKTDRGRRWQQEIELELAVTLVKEHMAIVVNRNTILRLFGNKEFRIYILKRDKYTCFFCGRHGDTIDHVLPRAKGGHTTPVNCVCACNECNQSKADRDADEFMNANM